MKDSLLYYKGKIQDLDNENERLKAELQNLYEKEESDLKIKSEIERVRNGSSLGALGPAFGEEQGGTEDQRALRRPHEKRESGELAMKLLRCSTFFQIISIKSINITMLPLIIILP